MGEIFPVSRTYRNGRYVIQKVKAYMVPHHSEGAETGWCAWGWSSECTAGQGPSVGPPREAWGWAGRPDRQKLLPGLWSDTVSQEGAETHGTWNEVTRVTAGRGVSGRKLSHSVSSRPHESSCLDLSALFLPPGPVPQAGFCPTPLGPLKPQHSPCLASSHRRLTFPACLTGLA